MGIRLSRGGFTIVELLIVIVVIGILATISLVAYNGITNRAKIAALQSNLSQAFKKIEVYKVVNAGVYPTTLAVADVTVPTGTIYNYQMSGSLFCLSATSEGLSYKVSNGNSNPIQGTCSGILADGSACPIGFIVVPGNSAFGTSEFCVMKYETKITGQSDGNQTYSSAFVPESRASGTPWVNISQTNAIAEASTLTGCSGCHLITDAEWLTIAHNVLNVASNWSGGSIGTGYIYSGHNDSSPNNSLSADTDDNQGYANTGQTSGNQRRTLTLSNGEVIWDLAGNATEWTSGTIIGGSQPGLSGEAVYTNKEYNNPSLIQAGLANSAYPSFGTPVASGWTSSQGIGMLTSNRGESAARAFMRGGSWNYGGAAGLLHLYMADPPSWSWVTIGFRVTR